MYVEYISTCRIADETPPKAQVDPIVDSFRQVHVNVESISLRVQRIVRLVKKKSNDEKKRKEWRVLLNRCSIVIW